MGKNIQIKCMECEAKLTPESKHYDVFKKKKVCVDFMTGHPGEGITGILEWVDVYTVGVQVEDRHAPTIIYKGPGMTIALADNGSR